MKNNDSIKLGERPFQEQTDRMIRVNQAGEYGAVRIYKGQLAILGKSEDGPLLEHMLEQEEEHLEKFNEMMVDRQVRPTVLSPIWHVAGFALGAGTALMGKKAAMACTVAIEEVIDEHYGRQQSKLAADPELEQLVTKCREDEQEHKETGLAHGAEQALGYPILSSAIKAGSRLAIWLSTRY